MLNTPELEDGGRREQRLERQIRRLNRRLASLQAAADRLTRWRLLLFLLAAGASLMALFRAGIWAWLITGLLGLIPFAVVVRQHGRVQTAMRQLTGWRRIRQTHLARLTLDWSHIPPTLPVPARLTHPFARDLDLVGHRSLHRLLDTTVSAAGSQRLRQWLLQTAPTVADIERRRALVQELTGLPRFRDRLALHATLAAADDGSLPTAGEKWSGEAVISALLQQRRERPSRRLLVGLSAAALLQIGWLALSLAQGWPPWWLILWVPYTVISQLELQRVGPLFQDAAALAAALEQLEAVLSFLEECQFRRQPRLTALCAPLQQEATRPSRQLRGVRRVVSGAGMRINPVAWILLNALTPWDLAFAYRLRQIRQQLRTALPAWLDIWAELEALCALATFADRQPGASLPVVQAEPGEPVFQATELGHPLIPFRRRVCNDYLVPALGQVTLITGSNMAGKSSFLRTLGVNLALALTGGPVVAASMRTGLFRLMASIQVADSVTDGYSFFYAEVRRLQAILAALAEGDGPPLFFLIDEIFRGTNNRERLLGSRAVLQALVGGRGVGVVATHDLALVALAEQDARIVNAHFRDDVQSGKMVFDYTLRPGPCPTTNALRIMRLAGLPVPDDETGA